MLLFILAFLSGAVFTGGLVAARIRRNQRLAVIERALVDLGNSLAMEMNDEDEYDRLRVYECVINRLMDDGQI